MPTEEAPPFDTAPCVPPRRRNVLISDIERLHARDPEALAGFFDATFEGLYSVAYRLSGNHATAEDLTQEVFLRVYRAAHTIDPTRDPWPWLMTILHNAFRDFLRSRSAVQSRRTVSMDAQFAATATVADPGDSPEQALLRRERDAKVHGAIIGLPPDQRTAVLLHSYAGLTHAEVASVVGSTVVAVRKLHSRATAALGKILRRAFE